jgi:imidazoleglycerol phosphate synthase glutamine amidotransferase subunit HisH
VTDREISEATGWEMPFTKIVSKLRNFIVHGQGSMDEAMNEIKNSEARSELRKLTNNQKIVFDMGAGAFYHLIETASKTAFSGRLV